MQTTPPCDVFQDVFTQTSDQQVSSIFFDVAVQTSSHGIHISSLDAAVQTIPHSTLSQHVSKQMGSRSASSFSVDMFVQTPIRSTVLHDVAIQLPITEFFIGCIFSNDPLDRHNFVRQSPSSVQDDIGSDSPSLTCTLTRSNLDCNDHVRTLAPRAWLQPPPGLEQLAPPPGLAIDAHLCTTHGTPVTAAPLRSRLRSAISVTPPQPPACTIHVGTHHARSATTGKRSASTAHAGTHNLADTDPRAGSVPFPKPRALVLPLARRAKNLLTLFPLPVGSSMRLFSRKPVIMFRTSLISLWRPLATRTSLSCSTRIPFSLTQKFSHSRSTLRAKVLGV